jgi:hypothetical protein
MKIELSPYAEASKYFFTSESVGIEKSVTRDIDSFLYNYLIILDLYVRLYFLPFGYGKKGFSSIKELFYKLSGRLRKKKNYIYIAFLPPPNHPSQKDLEYACQRINEKEIKVNGRRLWCEIS